MKFAFAPRGEYHPGQKITLLGSVWVIESVSHTGRQLIAHTPERAPKFERITVVLTDEPPIEEVTVPQSSCENLTGTLDLEERQI